MKHFLIKDNKEVVIASNLHAKCNDCFKNCDSPGLKVYCNLYNDIRRKGLISNKKGTTFLCCNETKTTKLFRDKLEALSYAYYDLILPIDEIENSAKINVQKRVNRLVHNLTSINAHNIQEIYDLVPQDALTKDINKTISRIEKEIVSNPKDAAHMFLRIAKHNIHMKSEFSIYKKLDRDNPTLDFRNHVIHKVLMNVLHTFFVDFSDKNVFVDVGECRCQIKCDYETVQVALYHIIENSSKYVKPKSTVEISFTESDNFVEVHFKMVSLKVDKSEHDKIFNEGFSGKEAKRSQKDGEGIGLWRVRQMLDLNEAEVEFIAGDEREQIMGFKFAENIIKLKFKKY